MKNPIAPNTKIRILSPEHSEYVQMLAFDVGFAWKNSLGLKATHTEQPFLFFRDSMEVSFVCWESDFELSDDLKEIFIDLPTEAELKHTASDMLKKASDLREKSGVKKVIDEIITGQKHDTDKPRYDLIPVHAEAAVVDVLTFGANKYAPDNWRHVDSATERYTSAALRHLSAYRMGEHEDQESGLPHLAHAACCLMFMLELDSEADK